MAIRIGLAVAAVKQHGAAGSVGNEIEELETVPSGLRGCGCGPRSTELEHTTDWRRASDAGRTVTIRCFLAKAALGVEAHVIERMEYIVFPDCLDTIF